MVIVFISMFNSMVDYMSIPKVRKNERSRRKDGAWRKKRSDAGKKRKKG